MAIEQERFSEEDDMQHVRVSPFALQQRFKMDGVTSVINLFDFNMEQITTIQRSLYNARDGASASTQTIVRDFNEVSPRAVKAAHAKLIELGGSPPPLDEEALRQTRTAAKKKTKIDMG